MVRRVSCGSAVDREFEALVRHLIEPGASSIHIKIASCFFMQLPGSRPTGCPMATL
jgi:predicted metal-binding protein